MLELPPPELPSGPPPMGPPGGGPAAGAAVDTAAGGAAAPAAMAQADRGRLANHQGPDQPVEAIVVVEHRQDRLRQDRVGRHGKPKGTELARGSREVPREVELARGSREVLETNGYETVTIRDTVTVLGCRSIQIETMMSSRMRTI